MKIYRIEHLLTGQGPYMTTDPTVSRLLDAMADEDHPAPFQDGIFLDWFEAAKNPQYSYGFETVAQLLNWFEETTLYQLFANDFYISTYECSRENVRLGRRHCAFIRDHSELLSVDDEIPSNI